MGYTCFQWKWTEFAVTATYFVPLKGTHDVCLVEITNTDDKALNLDIFYYVVPFLAQSNDRINSMRPYFYKSFKQGDSLLCITQRPANRFAEYGHMAVGCSQSPDFFETSYESFWGKGKYETKFPEWILKGSQGNVSTGGVLPVLVLDNYLNLKGGEKKMLSYEVSFSKSVDCLKKYQPISFSNAQDEFEGMKQKVAEDMHGGSIIKTPETDIDCQINTWTKYLVRQTKCITSEEKKSYRYITPCYQGGQCNSWGRNHLHSILHLNARSPERARKVIEDSSGNIFSTGFDFPDGAPARCDQPLWYAWAILDYIKNSGDTGVLDFEAAFKNSRKKFPIREHLERILRYYEKDRGKNGLNRIHQRDWNDALNCGYLGKGESVWCSFFYCFILKEVIRLCEYFQFTNAQHWKSVYNELSVIINNEFWNGSWYGRAVTDKGNIIGMGNRIFLLPQAWGILSGVCPKEKVERVVDSVINRLATPYGLALFDPPYSDYDSEIQCLSAFPEGVKENASIWCKTVSWMTMALALTGKGDLAFEYYKRHLPSRISKNPERYKLEPYIFCEYIFGPDSPFSGHGDNSWLTGSAVYAEKAYIEYILGIRAGYKGLFVFPSIPRKWKRCHCKRQFRGSQYSIEILNPDGVESGVGEIKVNGNVHNQLYLPESAKGSKINVEVILSANAVFKKAPDTKLLT